MKKRHGARRASRDSRASRGKWNSALENAEFKKVDGEWFRRLPGERWKRAVAEHEIIPDQVGASNEPLRRAVGATRTVWK